MSHFYSVEDHPLFSAPLPDSQPPFIVVTDASIGVEDVLSQDTPKGECPVVSLSRKLTLVEQKYTATEKAVLATKWTICSFHCYLWGQHFTDHAPLLWLQRMKGMNPHLTWGYLALQPYKYNIVYQQGKLHVNTYLFLSTGH